MPELKPCPFCGREVELRLEPSFGSDSRQEYWSIHCECPMGSPDALYDADEKQKIIDDWNTRSQV
jgi:hypothetical protein